MFETAFLVVDGNESEYESENEILITKCSKVMRSLRDDMDPFDVSENRFLKLFRFPKEIAREIINELMLHSTSNTHSSALPFHIKVLCTLHFLGSGSYQISMCNNAFSILSQPSSSRAINEVCSLVVMHLMSNYVRFPTTKAELIAAKQGFYSKTGITDVIGAIDGTHIRIIAPPSSDMVHLPYLYINRKNFHSINVMLICDSDQIITACNARYPGSVHDSAIWKLSDIRRVLNYNFEVKKDVSSHLIGDSGYPLEPYLFTPVRNPTTLSPEARYNKLHIKARNVIERTIGVLKGRFHCLLGDKMLYYHPAKAAIIIYTAVTLHNIAKHKGLTLPVDEENHEDPVEMQDEVSEDLGPYTDIEVAAVRARRNYIANMYN